MVLEEHEWNLEVALHVLQLFADTGADATFHLNLVPLSFFICSFLYFLLVCISVFTIFFFN